MVCVCARVWVFHDHVFVERRLKKDREKENHRRDMWNYNWWVLGRVEGGVRWGMRNEG